jgi:hypothetical protein
MPQATAYPADVVRQLIDAFNARDIERLLAVVSDDLEIRNPLGKAVRGLAGARGFIKANEQIGVFVEQDGPGTHRWRAGRCPDEHAHERRHRAAVGRPLRGPREQGHPGSAFSWTAPPRGRELGGE